MIAVVLCGFACLAMAQQGQPGKGPEGKGQFKGEFKGEHGPGGPDGPHGFGGFNRDEDRIASCVADKATRKTCVETKMKAAHAYIDEEKVRACFESCPKPTGEAKEFKGKGAAFTSRSPPVGTRQPPKDNGNMEKFATFRQCEETAEKKCLAQANVKMVEETKGAKGEFRGPAGGFGGGFGGGRGGNHSDDFLAGIVAMAAKCSPAAETCVKTAIGAQLMANTADGSKLIKASLCKAIPQCPVGKQCENDRAALQKTRCSCRATLDAARDSCMASAGITTPAPKASGTTRAVRVEKERNDPCSATQQPQNQLPPFCQA